MARYLPIDPSDHTYRGIYGVVDLKHVCAIAGNLFSMLPGAADVYAPAKRPFHTIIPGFVTKVTDLANNQPCFAYQAHHCKPL